MYVRYKNNHSKHQRYPGAKNQYMQRLDRKIRPHYPPHKAFTQSPVQPPPAFLAPAKSTFIPVPAIHAGHIQMGRTTLA
jgi:hypothetical protein